MDAPATTTSTQGAANPASSSVNSSTGPQIRSRVTVVCAECKRLKLRCDRRSPCGSCVKRDTVSRCVYSPAAAEKVDLHSLNNRLISVESQIALLSTCPISSSPSMMTFASGGSSLSIPLADVQSILLAPLDIYSSLTPSSFTTGHVKYEADPPEPTPLHKLLPAQSIYYSGATPLPSVPAELVKTYFPASPTARREAYGCIEEVCMMTPGVDWRRIRARCEGVFAWAGAGIIGETRAEKEKRKKAEEARKVFFGSPLFTSAPLDGRAETEEKPPDSLDSDWDIEEPAAQPSLPFFALMAALFALSALPAPSNPLPQSAPAARKGKGKRTDAAAIPDERHSPRTLLALSRQALDVCEHQGGSSGPGLEVDAVTALLVHVMCATLAAETGVEGYDGEGKKTGVESAFVLIGKLVNAARALGLHQDPDLDRGSNLEYNVKEARRGLWWGVVWCDLFISDALAHAPLINDASFTTRIPSNNDWFGARCRLAQLVHSFKKRASVSTSIDDSAALEGDINQYLSDIPPSIRVSRDDDPPHVVAQRCELLSTAHRLVLSGYLPFLNGPRSQQAAGGSVGAAHEIVHAARILQPADSRAPKPHTTSQRRTLFDAAAICAYAVVQRPGAVWASAAVEDVKKAADLLRRGQCGKEVLRFLDVMSEKATCAYAGAAASVDVGSSADTKPPPADLPAPTDANSLKRKRDNTDSPEDASTNVSGGGVNLASEFPVALSTPNTSTVLNPPFSNAHPEPSNQPVAKVDSSPAPPKPKPPPDSAAKKAGTPPKKIAKVTKKASYPRTGIRVRYGENNDSQTTSTDSPVNASPMPAPPLPAPSHTPAHKPSIDNGRQRRLSTASNSDRPSRPGPFDDVRTQPQEQQPPYPQQHQFQAMQQLDVQSTPADYSVAYASGNGDQHMNGQSMPSQRMGTIDANSEPISHERPPHQPQMNPYPQQSQVQSYDGYTPPGVYDDHRPYSAGRSPGFSRPHSRHMSSQSGSPFTATTPSYAMPPHQHHMSQSDYSSGAPPPPSGHPPQNMYMPPNYAPAGPSTISLNGLGLNALGQPLQQRQQQPPHPMDITPSAPPAAPTMSYNGMYGYAPSMLEKPAYDIKPTDGAPQSYSSAMSDRQDGWAQQSPDTTNAPTYWTSGYYS
ncbi:hypothetical protein PLICRDRAFT_696757 [Plicaturopsis crispa FD-325 SS-3]|nr:hypothetical protein PLICRDRAFT_696757 [Plicaturopsis crispa FD-325 SS-3]